MESKAVSAIINSLKRHLDPERCLTLNIINVCFRFFLFPTRSYANHSNIPDDDSPRLHTQLTLLSIKCKYCGSFASAQLQFAVVVAVVPFDVVVVLVVVATAVCCGSLELINYSINAINMHCC